MKQHGIKKIPNPVLSEQQVKDFWRRQIKNANKPNEGKNKEEKQWDIQSSEDRASGDNSGSKAKLRP